MALMASNLTSEVGLRILLCPLGSNIVLRTACCSVGIALPVYSTFKAIENKNNDEQQKWLLYWAAYGSFSLVEVFADKLISWIPMYYHLKFAFLVWLQLPTCNGAKQVYTNYLRPFFLRHQARIDQVLGRTYGEMVKLFNAHKAEFHYFRTVVLKIMGSADHFLKGGPEPHRPQQNAIEGGQRATTASVIESDHED
ncbi:HVA22-like protein k [Humulus lupulus]|uniref:HVA22-like protein k n=1 Tax=Humulus lupulus TaxID=3486 RepID=UPI002B40E698|nr:HVA22-like protein k [Humulus lupulus]